MELTYEVLKRFVQDHGDVEVQDTKGATKRLRDGTADVWDLALKADRLRYGGRWMGRDEFTQTVADALTEGAVQQIDFDAVQKAMPERDKL